MADIHPLAGAYLDADAELARHYERPSHGLHTAEDRGEAHRLHAVKNKARLAWVAAGCPIEPAPLTHVLREGLALCGAGMPNTWRLGDKWMSFEAPNVLAFADCGGCLDVLHKMAAG